MRHEIWSSDGTLISVQEIEEPKEELLRQDLLVSFNALPIGIQLALQTASTAIREALLQNKVALAREIVATYPLNGDVQLEAVRAAMLAKFDAFDQA